MGSEPAILLAEDAPQIAGIIVSKLSREGYAVTWRRQAHATLQALEDSSPQLILLGTTLQDQAAWDLLPKIHAQHPAIPIVMLLEQEEASDIPRAKRLGATEIILKPFKPTALAKTIKDIL